MPIATCPGNEQLAAFQSGKLEQDELSQIAEHLENCASCQTAIETDDTVADALLQELKRPPETDVYSEEGACRRAIAQIEQFANHDATKTLKESIENAAETPPPLHTFGKYQLLEVIGQGGMGTVYRAVHTLLKRVVAVKVLPAHRMKDPRAVSRFQREMEAAGRLDHPNIVRTSDAGEADSQHFLVMEWLSGRDLAKEVKERGTLPVAQACDFIRQAALGLDWAHKHGMVHRDVKPSNLFLTTDADGNSVVKVLDLGLALLHDKRAAETELTSDGQMMGTYDFIAPEQAMESHAVDLRADIYSLGCTFYFLLTGHTPFQGKSEAKKLLAHQLEQPTLPNVYREDIPDDVMAALARMLAKDPAQRYTTMRELADKLAECGNETDACTTPKSDTRESSPSPSLIPETSSIAARGVALSRGRRRIGNVALAIACLGILVAGVFGIIRVTTPDGDFVVETDDPAISISVSKGVVTLNDNETGRKYTLKVVREQKGEFVLDVSDIGADASFKVSEFTIKRGDKQVALKAWFERKVAPAVAKGTKGTTTVDDAWIKSVRYLPAARQADAVAAKLKDTNPEFDGHVKHKVEGDQVVELEFSAAKIADLSAVRALTALRVLSCSAEGDSRLADLTPLNGMKLTSLSIHGTRVSDLSPLQGMKLTYLRCDHTRVKELSPLREMPLTTVICNFTPVEDLSPLAGMKMTNLEFRNTNVANLTPLTGMLLTGIDCSFTRVTDLSPVASLKLKWLNCSNTGVANLAPVKSTGVTDLTLNATFVADLAPLRGMKLTNLSFRNTKVSDLAPLEGMPLRSINCDFRKEQDGAILRSLKSLERINGKLAEQFWKEVAASRN